MARQVLKVVSSAIAMALAERPDLKHQRAEVEIHEHSQTQQQSALGFCCLKAEQDTTRKKRILSIDYKDPMTAHPDPYRCELTSTIHIGGCFDGQQGKKLGLMQVWPPLLDASVDPHDCEQKCKSNMERYPKYHELLINQAKSDKEVEDALRATANLSFQKDYSSEMYKIHETYKDSLIAAARQATTATKTSIDKLASGENSDAKELRKEFESKMKDFQTKTKEIRPNQKDPDGDIGISNWVNYAAVETESALKATVSQHNQSLLGLLSTMKDEVNGFTSDFKQIFEKLNTERGNAEQTAQQTLKDEMQKLKDQAEAEQGIIGQLEEEQKQKAAQEPVLQGTTVPEECSHKECCCTIKLAEEATNVKVATNFLNWDVCQFPEVLQWKQGWAGGLTSFTAKMGATKCNNGFLTDCQECTQRLTCGKVGSCKNSAKITKIE